MPEPTTTPATTNESAAPARRGCIDEHTCACGEKHERHEDGVSHRESCTSPLKYGDTCCCRSDDDTGNAPHRCGHGPRCQ
ncbi:hypothetical protein [Methanoregula sp.]|uniref:hypothetical protein n=1 Tax=Methanoregula sp. TaxID=2052170 RepID=UPI003BAF1922